jgi:uncharacterized protein (DUF58 family)
MRASVETLLAWFRRGRLVPGAGVEAPLLDATELGELAQRLQRSPRPAPAQREVAHRRLGESRSVYRGSGMDYDESRPYQSGDDPRAMDWRLTARAGEPYVKLFREERRPATFILVDRRASMRFGTRVRLKVTQAARAAAVAAFDAQRRQSAIAGLLLESSPHWLAESASAEAALRFATAAARPAPPQSGATEPTLEAVLSQLVPLLVRGSTLWLISDFHDLSPACSGLLLQLAGEHQVHAVQVVDPAELALPAAGPLRLSPAGGGAAAEIDSGDAAVRARFAEAAAAHLAQRQERFAALNIPCVRLLSGSDALERELPL